MFITMNTILTWIIMFLGGLMAGYAISSKTCPAWVRYIGITFIAFDLGLLALALAEIIMQRVI